MAAAAQGDAGHDLHRPLALLSQPAVHQCPSNDSSVLSSQNRVSSLPLQPVTAPAITSSEVLSTPPISSDAVTLHGSTSLKAQVIPSPITLSHDQINSGIMDKYFPPLTTSRASPGKVSYIAVAKEPSASSKSLTKIQIKYSEVKGSKVADIPTSVLRSAPLREDLLIGKFPLGQAPHVAKVQVIVNKIWTHGNKTIKIDAFPVNDSTIKFWIKDYSTRLRVLRRGLWMIADLPMFIYKWSPNLNDFQPTMKVIPLWVTFQNVPRSLFSCEGLSLIASAIGEPKKLHPDIEMCVSFEEAKLMIEIDLTKELPQEFLARESDGTIRKINFIYPKLPLFCLHCQHWGHTNQNRSNQVTNGDKELDLPSLTSGQAAQVTSPRSPSSPSHSPRKFDAEVSRPLAIVASAKTQPSSSGAADPNLTANEAQENQISQGKGVEEEHGWIDVSPRKGFRSPISANKQQEIAVSSSFNVLFEADQDEEGEIKVCNSLEVLHDNSPEKM